MIWWLLIGFVTGVINLCSHDEIRAPDIYLGLTAATLAGPITTVITLAAIWLERP